MERDLHPVLKLWQYTERLKVSCLSKAIPGNWGQKSQVLVQWLFWNVFHTTCCKESLWWPSTPLLHELVVLRLQESSDQITLIDKMFYMDKGKVNFPRLVCSVINVCRIDCSLQRQPHACVLAAYKWSDSTAQSSAYAVVWPPVWWHPSVKCSVVTAVWKSSGTWIFTLISLKPNQ